MLPSYFIVPIVTINAVLGDKAKLPCDLSPSEPFDDVYLVLWYKQEAGKPLYR